MERESRSAADDFENDVEQAMEDKREGVLAADTTGMVSGALPLVPEPEPPVPKAP